MASTPDGSVVDEVNSGKDDPIIPPKGAGKANGPHSDGNPRGGAGARPHKECTPVMMMEENLKSKSLPQFLKDYQVKGLMHTC